MRNINRKKYKLWERQTTRNINYGKYKLWETKSYEIQIVNKSKYEENNWLEK